MVIHSSFIFNSPKLETIKMSLNWLVVKQTMANAHHGILVSIKKKQVIGPCKNLDGSQGHFQKVKHCIILFLLHCQKGTIIEIENKIVGARVQRW